MKLLFRALCEKCRDTEFFLVRIFFACWIHGNPIVVHTHEVNPVDYAIAFTAWKMSKNGVISGLYFPAFGLNTDRYSVSAHIQSECGKVRTRNYSVFWHFARSDQSLGLDYVMKKSQFLLQKRSIEKVQLKKQEYLSHYLLKNYLK